MHKKMILHGLLAALLASGLFFSLPARPVFAADLTVDTLTDENDGSCIDGDCSLRDALMAASSGNTIDFSVTGVIVLSSQLDINSDITISGPGAASLTLSGNNAVRVMRISPYTVSISGLTISNGHVVDDYGAGIWNDGILTLTDVVVSGNENLKSSGSPFGGGILNNGSLTFNGGALTGNTSGYAGGGLYSYFGSTLNLTDVLVDDNHATDVNSTGGGVFVREGSTAVFDNVVITNNSAPDSGGGLASDAPLTMTDSLIAGNSTAGFGGGMMLYSNSNSVTFDLANVTISGNLAGDGGSGYGGGIGVSGSNTLNLNNVTITDNTQIGPSGGGGIGASGTVNVKNTIIAGNTSTNSGMEDCQGTLNSQGYNLIQVTTGCTISGDTTGNLTGQAPLLDVLADNGGPSRTHALQSGSPAIDAGNDATCALTDQRGVTRPKGAHCDIGAYELVFTDVPASYWAYAYIERLFAAGITGGCGVGLYCPDSNVTRAQMAVFLLRGVHGSAYLPPVVGTGTGFDDVPVSHWAAAWIKQLAAEGITGGCGVNLYCPEQDVTRAEMAVFLLRSEHGASFNPPSATGALFTDVPLNYWAAAWIEQLAAESITSGCAANLYCPENPATRAQMAVFLVKTFNLP